MYICICAWLPWKRCSQLVATCTFSLDLYTCDIMWKCFKKSSASNIFSEQMLVYENTGHGTCTKAFYAWWRFCIRWGPNIQCFLPLMSPRLSFFCCGQHINSSSHAWYPNNCVETYPNNCYGACTDSIHPVCFASIGFIALISFPTYMRYPARDPKMNRSN